MALYAEILSLFLYCVQQLGVMLGAGGETVVLLCYLLATRDGIIDKSDERFVTAVKRVIQFGIFFIIASGVGITALHYSAGQSSILFEPAYLFKWSLIAIVLLMAIVDYGMKDSGPFLVGLVGGTWYGLFIVHILAPVSSWGSLGFLYAIWMLGFVSIWLIIARMVRGKKQVATSVVRETKKVAPAPIPAPAPTPRPSYRPVPAPEPMVARVAEPVHIAPQPVQAPTPPPMQAPHVPLMASIPAEAPKPAVFTDLTHGEVFPYKTTTLTDAPMLHPHLTNERDTGVLPTPTPAEQQTTGLQLENADVTPHLPAVRIMPRTPEDLETQHHRAPLIRFG